MLNLRSYLDWDSVTWSRFYKQVRICNKTRKVYAPKLPVGKCGHCGSENAVLKATPPSKLRFDLGTVHFYVECGNDACETHHGVVGDIHPPAAIHRFNFPNELTPTEES